MKTRRHECVLATKVWFELDRQAVIASVHDSLKRLQSDYIDVVQVHGRMYPVAEYEHIVHGGPLDALRDQASDIRAAADRLVAQAEAVAWTGRAANALRDRIRERASHLRDVAGSHDDAADSLDAHVAEVEVNVETGQVRVAHVAAAHDVGRAINPQGLRGQVEGAVVMSLGLALMEEYLPGVTRGLNDYYLPTARCMPRITVIPVEVPSRWGPLGAKGLGEAATLATAPAILNGIYHACGARVRTLPATPERVLAAMREAGARNAGRSSAASSAEQVR